MSTTTKPAYNGNAVQAYTEQGLTPKQATAVAMREAGMTNQQGGDAFAEVFGQAIKSGGFGNLYANGMRALGRESELATPVSGGGRTRKARTPIEAMQDELERVRENIDNLDRPVVEATAMFEALDTDTVVTSALDKINEQVKALQAEAKAIKSDPSAVLDAERAKLQARLDAATTRQAERAEQLRSTEAQYVAVLKTLGA